jgi:hypothetical protein
VGIRRENRERRVKADASHDEDVPEKAMMKEWAIGESLFQVSPRRCQHQGPWDFTACRLRNPPLPTGNLCRLGLQFTTPLFFVSSRQTRYSVFISRLIAYDSYFNPIRRVIASRQSRFPIQPNRHHGRGRRCSRHAGSARRRAAQTTQEAKGGGKATRFVPSTLLGMG